jgi:GNAT superfamily N-acetyltransferase
MIRAAITADVPEIHAMIRELAEYERALEDARATRQQLTDALFGEHPAAFALIAQDDATGSVVGFALWFRNFSTWTGTHGVYLEDLYVRPTSRGAGHGRALLAELASICVERGYERFEWSALEWNAPAIGFYRAIGAVGQEEWILQRLTGEPLRSLAQQAVVNKATSLSN